MTKDKAIVTAKSFRVRADDLLQEMKEHKRLLVEESVNSICDDKGELIAQHTLSIRELESCIMRQKIILKTILRRELIS